MRLPGCQRCRAPARFARRSSLRSHRVLGRTVCGRRSPPGETQGVSRFCYVAAMALPPVILVAPAAFKGTLGPRQVAEALATGVRRGLPRAIVLEMPVPHGGY